MQHYASVSDTKRLTSAQALCELQDGSHVQCEEPILDLYRFSGVLRLSRAALAAAIRVAGPDATPSPAKDAPKASASGSSSKKKDATDAAASGASASPNGNGTEAEEAADAESERDARFVHKSLNAENLLLRGSVVRNTAFAFGVFSSVVMTD